MNQTFCSIVPPTVLLSLAEGDDAEVAAAAQRTLDYEAALFAQWSDNITTLRQTAAGPLPPDDGKVPANTVYDMQGGDDQNALPGAQVRGTTDPAVADTAVNEAFDGAASTVAFYKNVFGRNSIDGRGLDLVSSVHFGQQYDNAFWNGQQMVYGDGGGGVFVAGGLTKSIDVIGHELTHGVTQYTADLRYQSQSGALNESFSDVMGILVKQYTLGISATDANWLIGEGTVDPSLGQGLRNMLHPGTAFKWDQQPADMDHYIDLPVDENPRHDNGGVHLNSSIPNRAFAEAAVALGGNAWGDAGRIWYQTLTGDVLTTTPTFADAAAATIQVAGRLFGAGSAQQSAVQAGWDAVKVVPAGVPSTA